MALQEYKKKRKFADTPEPASSKRKTGGQLHFVVQEHHASHLHYDFRLEMADVLKSWAVPKGPAMDPTIKRLAIQVEDHPYAYKDFEGTIPKGNYGAGTVKIWDEGTYEPIKAIKDPDKYFRAGLKKGHISFMMHGHKLHGEFSLVKLENGSKNQWLLIKKNDKEATKKDVLLKKKSVRRATKNPLLKNKSLEKTKFPAEIKPMLAKLINKPFDNKEWLYEIKWDGFRILAYVKNKSVTLLSRNQKNYNQIFSIVKNELAILGISAVFDGEMVVVDKNGRADFQLLQNFQKTGQGNLVYYVFDLIWLNGYSLVNLPLIERKEILKEILPNLSHVKISEHIIHRGKAFFKAAKEHHLEGIMAKFSQSHYLSGQRSTDWLKIKTKARQEAVIAGYTAPRGSRHGFGAVILGVYQNGQLQYIGHTGGGFDQKLLAELKKRFDKLVQKECPFSIVPKTNAPVTWLKPHLVCEVSFAEWTTDGRMRQPIFLGLREDKFPRSVKREIAEQPVSTDLKKEETPMNELKTDQDELLLTVDKVEVKLTHLNKIYWPDEKYTKKDLIAYYYKMAPIILPYIYDHPEILNRFPNGIKGGSFYQKNVEKPPKWIKTKKYYSESTDEDVNYLICQNTASLLYMINLGCIEVNPWLSTIKNFNKPTFCLIDLDPEGIGFPAVIKVANVIHKLLDKIGADHYCKTSGATGLHICIPLAAKYTFKQSQQFAQLVVTIINEQLPEITSIERSPKKRQAKVYLDYLQNRRGQSMAAPYSVRPRPKAPVSTPLKWSEVKSGLSPLKFTMKNIFKRLEKQGDLWQPVFGKGVDLKACLEKLNQF